MIDRFRGKPNTDRLLESQECLCGHVGQLTDVIADLNKSIDGLVAGLVALAEQELLLRRRLERIDGRLDRAEQYGARTFGYPHTQLELPDLDEWRAWIENGRKDR